MDKKTKKKTKDLALLPTKDTRHGEWKPWDAGQIEAMKKRLEKIASGKIRGYVFIAEVEDSESNSIGLRQSSIVNDVLLNIVFQSLVKSLDFSQAEIMMSMVGFSSEKVADPIKMEHN